MTEAELQTFQSITTTLRSLKDDEYPAYMQLVSLLFADYKLYTNTKVLDLLKSLTIAETA